MIQARIKPDSAQRAAVRESLPIVRRLAAERAKPWPTRGEYRLLHQNRIAELEDELSRIAGRLNGVSGNELERLGLAELRDRRFTVPQPKPVPIDHEKNLIDAEMAFTVVENLVTQERRLIADAQVRLAKLEADLDEKRKAVELAKGWVQ